MAHSALKIIIFHHKQIFASWKKNQLATNWPDLQTNLPQNVFFNVYYYNSVNTTIKTVKFSVLKLSNKVHVSYPIGIIKGLILLFYFQKRGEVVTCWYMRLVHKWLK